MITITITIDPGEIEMADRVREIDITADGNSIVIDASSTQEANGEWTIAIMATTWGASTSAALEFSMDQTNWAAVTLGNTISEVAFTANGAVIVPAGIFYRWVITSFAGSAGMVGQGVAA